MKKVKFTISPEIKIYIIDSDDDNDDDYDANTYDDYDANTYDDYDANTYDDNNDNEDNYDVNTTLWNKKINTYLLKTSKIVLNKIDFNINQLWEKILSNNPKYFIITSRKCAIEFILSIIQIITIEYNNYPLKLQTPIIKYSNIYAAAVYFLQVKCNLNQNLNLDDIEYVKNIKGIVGYGLRGEQTLTIKELYEEIDYIFPL